MTDAAAGTASVPPASSLAGRAAQLAAVVGATVACAWLLWPRPALELEVDAAGRGAVVGRFGRSPLPETLYVAGGRRAEVRLVNRSDRPQQLGIFAVGPRDTRSYRLGAPGVFGGYCSAHPTSRRLVYVVR